MKKLIAYIAFAFLSVFSATSGLSVLANGCSSPPNKAVEIKCAKNNTDCQTQKAENFKVIKTVRS